MKQVHKILALVPLATALFIRPGEVPLRFGLEPGDQLTRTMEQRLSIFFEEMTSRMDGQEIPKEYLPQMEIEMRESARVVVVDRFTGVGPLGPTTFVRHFESIEAEVFEDVTVEPYYSGSRTADGTSALEGQDVRFDWNPALAEYGAVLVDDGEPVHGLVADLDYLALLPDASTELGDTWDLDEALAKRLFRPIGELNFEWSEDLDWDDDEEAREAELSATLAGFEDNQGQRFARIELAGQLRVVGQRATDLSDVPVADGNATETTTSVFDLTGALRWDTSRGCVASLHLSGDVLVTQLLVKDPGQAGGDFENTMILAGDWGVDIEVERE